MNKAANKTIIDEIIDEVKTALSKYSSENIDVTKEKSENGDDILYVVYHSRHNSFAVSDKTYPFKDIDTNKLETKLDELGVGYVW